MSSLSRREIIRQIRMLDQESGGPGTTSGVDEDRIKELDLDELKDLYLNIFGEEAKASTRKSKKVAKVKSGGIIKKFSSGGIATRGFGKVIK